MAAKASTHSIALVMVVLYAAPLAACADLRRAASLPPVNPESPVAAEVAAAARRNFATPSFADVPPTPKNLPQAAAIKGGVIAMIRCRQAFERWTSDHPALVADSSGFAEALRGRAQVNPADVPAEGGEARSEAFAAGLRAFAAPPPPIESGPPPAASDAVEPLGRGRPPGSSRPRAAAAPKRNASAAASPPQPTQAPTQLAEARPFASVDGGAFAPPLPELPPGPADAVLDQCQ